MRVGGKSYRSVWLDEADRLHIIDQTVLPYGFEAIGLASVEKVATAIKTMQVRGAPLIGVTAAFGVWLAAKEDPSDNAIDQAIRQLGSTRPTAVNLAWALARMRRTLFPLPLEARAQAARAEALLMAEEDVETCRRIGDHGLVLLEKAWHERPGEVLNVLTHCNAGWLATVDWGTALAPIYRAHDAGMGVHVWVDETRPRNQGMLTAWELGQHGVPHTLIADNEGGHLMQKGRVDLCIVGSDRTTASGDVCNKIGTYLKALAAHDNEVPFYVALPSSTLDWTLEDGASIPIEERSSDEVKNVNGLSSGGQRASLRVTPLGTETLNHAFDVTPARLVTGIITERGVCEASRAGLERLFPEKK